MSHHPPPIASIPPLPAGARRPRGRVPAWVGLGVALVAFGACGNGDRAADPSPGPTTLIDAVTGEPVTAPEGFTLNFDPASPETASESAPDDQPASGPAGGDDLTDEARGGGNGATSPGEPEDDAVPNDTEGRHPLESIVIDTVVTDPDAAPVLDEAAALACANTEFAMDALIESSDQQAQRFATAAEWAAESDHGPIRAFADRLADAPTGAEANDLVVAVLETCAGAGYEL